MLPALLAQIGLPLLLGAVRGALGKVDHPAAKGAAGALDAVDEAIAGGDISAGQLAEANRHIETMAALESAEARTTLTEVNRTIRAEVASGDAYVRRMRPTFGYIMAATWAAQMGALAWVIIDAPGEAANVIAAMASLGVIWSVGLSVLGIYVYQRSQEKRAGVNAASGPGGGVGNLARLIARLAGREQ